MNLKKRSFTLLELMISLALFSLIVTTLFYFYGKTFKEQKVLEKAHAQALEEHYFDVRLKKMLPQVKERSYFYTHDDALVFIFDNGVDPDPLLSQNVLAKLYLYKKIEAVCLGIWPYPTKEVTSPHRTYILLPGVKNLSFKFYTAPDRLLPIAPAWVGEEKPPPEPVEKWKRSYKNIPTMMKIITERSATNTSVEFGYIFEINSTAIGLPKS